MLQAAVEDVSREEQQRAPDIIERAGAADLKRLDTMPARRLVTLFGELTISRPVYAGWNDQFLAEVLQIQQCNFTSPLADGSAS